MFLKSECKVIGLLLPLLRQMQENTQKHVTVCDLFVSTTTNRNMCKNRYEKLCSTGSHTYGKVQHKHNSDRCFSLQFATSNRAASTRHAVTCSGGSVAWLQGHERQEFKMRGYSSICCGVVTRLWPAPLPPVLTGGCPPLRGGPLSTGGPKVPSSCR